MIVYFTPASHFLGHRHQIAWKRILLLPKDNLLVQYVQLLEKLLAMSSYKSMYKNFFACLTSEATRDHLTPDVFSSHLSFQCQHNHMAIKKLKIRIVRKV